MRAAFGEHVKSGELKTVVQFGRDRAVPFFGDATRLYEMLKSDEQKMVADVIFQQTELARPLAAPPGTPPERVAALRKAMLETLKDAALANDAGRMQIDFDAVPGEETVQMIAGFYRTPPELVQRARQFTEPEQK
jgi:hypothetical protein